MLKEKYGTIFAIKFAYKIIRKIQMEKDMDKGIVNTHFKIFQTKLNSWTDEINQNITD